LNALHGSTERSGLDDLSPEVKRKLATRGFLAPIWTHGADWPDKEVQAEFIQRSGKGKLVIQNLSGKP
jgi:hypothetical protein